MALLPFINRYNQQTINYKNNRLYMSESLDFSYHFIGDLEVNHIVENLKSNSTVVFINLNGNYISDEGAIAITLAVIYNTTLRKICLQDNNISYRGKSALIAAKKRNKNIEIFY
jgi:hypothetical protein